MPVMDEFKEERDLMKDRSFKEKCSYFWDYYKWHVIGGIALVFIAFSLIRTIVTHRDTAFYAAMINTGAGPQAEAFKEGFAEAAGIDTKKYQIYLDTDMHLDLTKMDDVTVSTTQKMMVYVAAGDIDVLVSDITGMDRYAYNEVMIDLRDFLSPEDFEKYSPLFYYMDRALVEDADVTTADIAYPKNPSDPSTMTDPIPVGILVNSSKVLSNSFLYGGNRYFCVLVNSAKMDYAHTFLDYLEVEIPAVEDTAE